MDSAGLGTARGQQKAVDPCLTTALGQRSASLHVDHTDHSPLDDDSIFLQPSKTGSAIYRQFLTIRHFIYTLDLTNPKKVLKVFVNSLLAQNRQAWIWNNCEASPAMALKAWLPI
jgi:hypothetical protein